MGKGRLEAFSDGVIAIIITIMVLNMKVPQGAQLADLAPAIPTLLSYMLSFIYVGIYWNNHHHMLHTISKVNGWVLWANLHLLFWLSLIPFATDWMGINHFAPIPVALYGVSLLLPAVAYYILERSLVLLHGQDSHLAKAVGLDYKGLLSLVFYLAGIGFAFIDVRISLALYVFVAALWFIPDRRIEHVLQEK